MNIFITGASGFLGNYLTCTLKRLGHQVKGVSSQECDLQWASSLDPYRKEKFDQIYHLAVWTQAGDFCLHHPAEQWLINQKINTHLLSWWQTDQPQAKLIATGTSCAYDPFYPLEESYYLSGKPIDSLTAFAMTKRMLLSGLQAIHQQYGLDYLFLIPATLYGIEEKPIQVKKMHFIFDLAHKIARGKIYQEPVILWGNGEQKRELLHAEDFVQSMIALSEICKNESINVGTGEEFSIRDFAKILCEKADFPFSNIQFDTSRYVGARSKKINTNRLKTLLPLVSFKPLKEGLDEMMQWALSIQKKAAEGSS